MAGAGKQRSQDELKNKAMLVVRNITKQEVTNVIFPNGITVGAAGPNFKNGFRVHGNAQVSGIVNAQGFKVNGQDLQTSGGGEFLFIDVDLNAVPISLGADNPGLLQVQITQNGQSETITSSDVTAFKNGGTPGPLTSLSITETTGPGNSFSSGSLDISTLRTDSDFPITFKVEKGGRTSTKKVYHVENGAAGSAGTPGSNGATTIPLKFTIDYTSQPQQTAINVAQLCDTNISSLSEGFLFTNQTFGATHGSGIFNFTGLSSVQATLSLSPAFRSVLWYPTLSSSTGELTSVSGVITQASITGAGTGAKFNLVLYETSDTIANTPTKLEPGATLSVDGSTSGEAWASSGTHIVKLSSPVTLRDGYGYTLGLVTSTNATPTGGSITVDLQLLYTGM